MMLSFTSFYSSSLWAQVPPCNCPFGWSTQTLIIYTNCSPVEVTVCCSPNVCSGPYVMIICNVIVQPGVCNPPTPAMFQQISDQLININPCNFPCDQIPKTWEVTGPCRVKVSTVSIGGNLFDLIEWADPICSVEPCHHRYTVTCDDFGNKSTTGIVHDASSCARSLQSPTPVWCINVCN